MSNRDAGKDFLSSSRPHTLLYMRVLDYAGACLSPSLPPTNPARRTQQTSSVESSVSFNVWHASRCMRREHCKVDFRRVHPALLTGAFGDSQNLRRHAPRARPLPRRGIYYTYDLGVLYI